MSLTNPNTPVSQQDLKDFYDKIKPYMGLYPSAMGKKIGKGDIYSTEERLIGQWIDSKPLYQITFVIDPLTLTGTMTDITLLSLGVTNCDYISVKDAYIYCVDGYWIACPFYGKADDFIMVNAFNLDSGNDHLRVCVPANYQSKFNKLKVTIQYTKTTDSAISIGDETDYSTTEKIVGTWIDGKPVWQKTIEIPESSFTKYRTYYWYYDISSIGISDLVKFEATVVRNNVSLSQESFDFTESSMNFANSYSVYGTASRIEISMGSNRQNISKVIATIQYIKTT